LKLKDAARADLERALSMVTTLGCARRVAPRRAALHPTPVGALSMVGYFSFLSRAQRAFSKKMLVFK
jgi:hypothetical protein